MLADDKTTPAHPCACVTEDYGKPPPPKKTTTIKQAIKVANIANVAAYMGDVKKVYETGYAVALFLWDSATKKIKEGNSVTSIAAAAVRRAGVTITFTATVKDSEAAAAQDASTTLATSPAGLVSGIATAKTDLGITAVTAPTAAQLTPEAPRVTERAGGSLSSASMGAQMALAAALLSATVTAITWH